jgi:D-glycero-alpha-D-manno-heptose-7-phosphate kinase
MLIRSRAPIRIDLAGGWTDVSPFADREGGAVVNVALNRYTYTSVRPRSDRTVHLRSDDYAQEVESTAVDLLVYDGRLDLAKAALKRLRVDGGIDIATRSDAPPGSGLGTSAAMAVAILGAVDAFQEGAREPSEVAALAHLLEVEELGIAGGKQDQLAAALGGINFLEFGAGTPVSTPLQVRPGVINELEKRLVLCYSGISRLSGDIIQRVQQAYLAEEPSTCGALRTMRDLARALRPALDAGDVEELGPILRENWRCQRALHRSVSNAEVDALFAIAEHHGALGGKACGAGGGGCLVFFAADGAERGLRDALAGSGAQIIDFNIDRAGLQVWRIDSTTGRVL